jgi:hypothetical protein
MIDPELVPMRRLLPHATYPPLLIRVAACHLPGSTACCCSSAWWAEIESGCALNIAMTKQFLRHLWRRRNKLSPIVLRTVKRLEMTMSTSHQGIDKHKGEMQPSDKDRAQTAHKTSPDKSASHESTRDSKLDDHPKKSGSQ